jgi:hypothetical protein
MPTLRARQVLTGLAGLAGTAFPANAAGPVVDVAVQAAAGSTVKTHTAIRFVGLGAAANKVTVSGFGPTSSC